MERPTQAELIAAVKAHALDHYETGGWDFVIEAWDDDEIAEHIGGARTVKGAIRNVASVCRAIDDHRKEIVASGDW